MPEPKRYRIALSLVLLLAPAPLAAGEEPPPAEPPPSLEERIEDLLDLPLPAPEPEAPRAAPFRAWPVGEAPPEPPAAPEPTVDPPAGLEEERHELAAAAAELAARRETLRRLLELKEDEQAALAAIRAGEGAPLLQRSTTEVFAFGRSQPRLVCTPDRACDIELAPGEEVYAVACGDTERWTVERLWSGPPERRSIHVIVMPSAHGIATNLVVGTTERTYHIALVSPPLEELREAETHYLRHLSFYYPEELTATWATPEEVARLEAEVAAREARVEAAREEPAGEPLAAPVGALHFDYRLRGPRRIPWRPVAVWDDGVRTFVQLPESARGGHPTLLVRQGGESFVPNARWEPETRRIVVPMTFDEARLVQGVGRKRREVRILRGGR